MNSRLYERRIMPDNDNSWRTATSPMPDAHGHAALLLVESLIHGLIERSVITVENALDIVETANSVQIDVAEEADGQGAPMWQAHTLLSSIAQSLSYDSEADGDSPPPLRPVP
jgi:hypothetical protein